MKTKKNENIAQRIHQTFFFEMEKTKVCLVINLLVLREQKLTKQYSNKSSLSIMTKWTTDFECDWKSVEVDSVSKKNDWCKISTSLEWCNMNRHDF